MCHLKDAKSIAKPIIAPVTLLYFFDASLETSGLVFLCLLEEVAIT
jgi:hypothetical protein